MSSLSRPQSAEVLLKGAIWIWNRHKSVLWLARIVTMPQMSWVPQCQIQMRVGSRRTAIERETRNRSNLPVSQPKNSIRPKIHWIAIQYCTRQVFFARGMCVRVRGCDRKGRVGAILDGGTSLRL